MKTLFVLILCCFTLSFAYSQAKHNVQMLDNSFSPSAITVNVGDTVVWINNGLDIHTSTSGTNCQLNNTWNSGNLNPGGTFSFVFTSAGSFPYFCIPHCALGMTGTITVQMVNSTRNRAQYINEINLYPNPVSAGERIYLSNLNNAMISIALYDLNGKVLYEGITENSILGTNSFNLEKAGLKPGYYLVRLIVNENYVYSIPLLIE
jgi:plastocyanin